MASPINAVLCALVGAAFWSVLGYVIARHLLPRVLALGAAPVIGWAIFSAVALPILSLIGFSTLTVVSLAALGLGLAAVGLRRGGIRHDGRSEVHVPGWDAWLTPCSVLICCQAD